MKAPLFSRDDLSLLRAPVFFAVVCASLAILMYAGSKFVNSSVSNAYALARGQFEQVQTSIQQIAQEEGIFVEYIDRYREMLDDALFEEEDRLAILERVQSIRQQLRLFPVEIEMEEQAAVMLSYPSEVLIPGEPVQIRLSPMRISFSLLHEEDFTGLMTELLNSRGYFLPMACELSSTVEARGYVEVADNLAAECDLVWLSYLVNPPEPVYVE